MTTTTGSNRAEHQQRVDEILAQIRREVESNTSSPAPPVSAPPLDPSTDVLSARLAEELDEINRLLEDVGDRLIADPVVLERHANALQSLDLIAQVLGHVSSIIAAANRDDAVARIGMEDMRNRLSRAA